MSGLVLPPPPLLPGQAPLGRAALLLDFDGTLVEIAPRPDAVRVPPALPGVLARLAAGLEGALAVVSGRRLDELDHFLPIGIAKAGEHGAAIRPAPGVPPEIPPLPAPPAIWRLQAMSFAHAHPGALVEEKPHGFVVHYRQAPQIAAAAEALLRDLVQGTAFQLMPAHMAWEVRPKGPSKGGAVRRLMQEAAFAGRRPVFIGDDVTDLEGIAAARALGGEGWLVPDAFGSPAAVRAWLDAAVHQ